jgi:hypothetical protein
MRLLVPEILQLVSDAKTTEERVNILKQQGKNNSLLTDVLKMNFDAALVFDLPAGAPPYKVNPQPLGLCDSNLYSESRRFYLLLKDHPRRPAGVKPRQVENIFIQIIEAVHALEAEMMIVLKDKQLHRKYRGVTERVVREAFPGLLPEAAPKTQ